MTPSRVRSSSGIRRGRPLNSDVAWASQMMRDVGKVKRRVPKRNLLKILGGFEKKK
ncbi:MAG: hypothetical protein WCI04_03640 [archaeon]